MRSELAHKKGTIMFYYAFKVLISLALIIAVAEIAKRSSVLGGILASVPIISVLAMIWLYIATNDVEKVAMLSRSILWLVLPSLSLFISLPILLTQGINFLGQPYGLIDSYGWLLLTNVIHA